MGKKRRILRSPKFANLRKHRKFKLLVENNLKEEKEEISVPTIEKENITEVGTTEITKVKAEKPKIIKPAPVSNESPQPKPKAPRRRKPSTKRKAITKAKR